MPRPIGLAALFCAGRFFHGPPWGSMPRDLAAVINQGAENECRLQHVERTRDPDRAAATCAQRAKDFLKARSARVQER
jgi:hypothetical protein